MLNLDMQRPSRRRQRPSAYDVSFGTDPDDSAATSDASRKRDRIPDAGDADLRNSKRRNLDGVPRPARKYEARPYEVPETGDLIVFGEDEFPPDDGLKRTRLLSHFSFFDATHDDIMVSLDVLANDGAPGGNHRVLGAGFVVARYEIEEEDGQEDEFDDLDAEHQYIRLSRIHRFFTRYWEANSPFYVETDHAIYELHVANPSKRYRSQFRPFWRLQMILRLVISTGDNEPEQEFSGFMREYNQVEILGQPLTESELWDAVPKLRETLATVPRGDKIRSSIVVRHLLSRLAPVVFKPVGARADQRTQIDDPQIEYNGNLDLAVLKKTTRTHVTPRIEQLAGPLFREVLKVVGPRPRAEPEAPRDDLALRLQGFLLRAATDTPRRIQFRPDQRIGRSRWLKHIIIDDVKYEIGDTVVFYPGKDGHVDPYDLPPTDTLADHFWFAKIIYMNEDHETVHVQWFEHSSKTYLQELGHSQELFLTNQCDMQYLRLIIGKVTTHYIKPGQSLADIRPHDFFYRYMWESYEGTFTNVNEDALATAAREPPPDNCPVCNLSEKIDRGEQERIHLGIRWYGTEYHLDDFVFIRADEGPCHIGHITKFIPGREGHGTKVVVRLLGRTDRIGTRPDTTLKDERHLFYTDDEMTTPTEDLIGICFVVVKRDMPDLDEWLTMSPNRFYVKYRFRSLSNMTWNEKRRIRWDELPICPLCVKPDMKKFRGTKAFLESAPPLRIFDPFCGTGSFGLAMEELGCFKLTHAVEISPSAARTIRNNASPGTKVYNQCCNLVLRDAILTHENKNPEPLKSIEGHPLPPFPKPGDIDCIVTGFPCQPHSTLNMYKRANDRSSSLILTVLSFVDFLKPSYCIFENVRGFLRYSLRARQDGKYAVKGGIQMGGLKLVSAALLDMGYQLRCGLLQAGHYGTPQTRVRFFLIAAKRGLELPEFPQPTHDFPVNDGLEIKFPEGLGFDPICTRPGVAPHRYVSVHDAISDLPKFEWKNPKKVLSRREMEQNRIKECNKGEPWCGFSGPNVEYEHEPRTRFQQWCRTRPTRDIQQYTRTYDDPKKIERVVTIPVEEDADYRKLPPDLWEWQLANPASATARGGHRGGYYGRVQRDGWFQTTVANVDPMAKQCRVIHPYSRRIVTVRELARSQGFPDHFVFHALDDRVMTMHRQIGNAMPWPVSMAIAREFREVLYKDWSKRSAGPPEPEDVEFSSASDDDGRDTMEVD